jgi:hypothetical protein
VQVVETEEAARPPETQSTLFYMPYCPCFTTEDLLDDNWDRNALVNIGILGLSLDDVLSSVKPLEAAKVVFDRVAKAKDSTAIVEVQVSLQDVPSDICPAFDKMTLTLFPQPYLCCHV